MHFQMTQILLFEQKSTVWYLFLGVIPVNFFSFLNFISLDLNYIAPLYGCYLKCLNFFHGDLLMCLPMAFGPGCLAIEREVMLIT